MAEPERFAMVLESAKNVLRVENLREYQKSAIIATLKGKDVFVSQTTGAGKSLVYQMLPFAIEKFLGHPHQDNFVLVVSPLISLIRDQTMILEKLAIKSLLDANHSVMRNKVVQERLSAVVVDESHCIVKWGSNSRKTSVFRRSYGKIAELRSMLRHDVPFIAMTATATNPVLNEIIEHLEMKIPVEMFLQNPNRQNIRYSLINLTENNQCGNLSWLLDRIEKEGKKASRAIVFSQNRNLVHSLYGMCEEKFGEQYPHYDERPYDMFHADIDNQIKEHIIREFGKSDGVIKLLFATVAFGMGIDCKDLHEIIHYGPPHDVDDYCQETGRAGRNNKQSHASLVTFPRCLGKNSTKAMKEYCENTTECRRKLLNKNFPGEAREVSPMHLCCDICTKACKCGGETCGVDINTLMSDAEKWFLQLANSNMLLKAEGLGNRKCFLNDCLKNAK
eukprot:gene1809-2027_t